MTIVGRAEEVSSVAEAGERAKPFARLELVPQLASVREFVRLQALAPRQTAIARVFGVDPVARENATAYAGALAEVTIADAIAALDEQWTALEHVPLGDHEHPVSHLLVGPAGVISIALRTLSGEHVWVGERTFLAGETKLPHVRDVEHEAELVSGRMSAATDNAVSVTACLVVAGAFDLTVQSSPRRVEVMEPKDFAAWLHALPRLFSPKAVDQLRTAALSPTTWPGSPCDADSDALVDRAAFDALHRRVVSARRRRLAWAMLGAALSQASTVWLASSMFGSSGTLL